MSTYDLNNNAIFKETDDANTTWFNEGMNPADVDDGARAIIGASKRLFDKTHPTQTSTGSANAYALTYTVSPVAYVSGDRYCFASNMANTGPATLNVNALGAKPIVRQDGSALASGDIGSGSVVEVAYTGTSFVLVNVPHAFGSADVTSALGYTPANKAGDTMGALTLTNPLTLANGGTGAADAAGARAALSLGSAALVNTSGSVTWTGPQNFTGGLLLDNQNVNWSNHGQCRLIFITSTSIRLTPFNGNKIYIPGSGVVGIANVGVTVSNAGLVANTVYYVYAFSTGSNTLFIEFSTTGHTPDATTGIEVKTGDTTRVLIGMIRTNGSSQFADSPSQRFVASWFNRRPRSVNGIGTTTPVSGTVIGELNAAARIEFLVWSSDAIKGSIQVSASNNTGGQFCAAGIGLDGTNITSPTPSGHSHLGGYVVNLSHSLSTAPGEGYHFLTPMGFVSGGIGTFTAALTATATI